MKHLKEQAMQAKKNVSISLWALVPDRPDMVSAQVVPRGTPIGGECIEMIQSLVDQANLSVRNGDGE